MGRTFIRQDVQVGSTGDSAAGFLDNITPSEANYETNASDLAYDLNAIRSKLQDLHNRDGASFPTGNWWDSLTQPSALENGTIRGVDAVNAALHAVEKKRVMRGVDSLVDIAVPASQNWVVLGAGELPPNTTAAVGAVTTLGTIVAQHGGSFGSHALDEVAGSTAINPKNLVEVFDGATRDPIVDSGDERVWGLLQTENGTDGHTIGTSTPNRAQLSFVKVNATGDDLEAVAVADIESKTINVRWPERVRLEDLTEQDFLRGAIADVPSGATVTRQAAYDSQGATPVDATANAILDLEGAGLVWRIRDDAEAMLFEIVEGSAGGTSQVNIGSDVDEFDVDALVNNFAAGISARSGGTRPIDIGVNDGVIESTAGALELQATTTLSFDDGSKPVGWSLAEGVHLSDAAQEWTDFEANFGEVSLLNAINQAYEGQLRTKVQAVLTSNVSADTDVNGPSFDNNTDVDLAPYDQVTFVDDVEVYLNGELLRNAANDGGGEDVYPGGTPADGDLKFQFALKGTGSKPDQLTVIVNGQ